MRNLTRSCSGLFGDDSPEAAALRAHQIFVLARGAPAMAIGNIVNSGLTALVFLGEAPWPLLMGWLAVIWLFAALRLKSWWRNRNRPRPEQAGRRALVRSTVWSCIAGSAWGLAAITLMNFHSVPAHVLLAFVVGGQAAAAAIWLSPLPAAYWTYILISMAPLVAGFALAGEPLHLAMAGMLFVFTGVLLFFARTTHKKFVEAIKAGFERERLVAELEAAHAELEERVSERTAELSRSNQRLKEEIAARRQTEEELRESRDSLRLITDNLPVLIAYLDSSQVYKFVNKRTENWFGMPAGKIIGRRVDEIIDRPYYEKFKPHIDSVLAGNIEIFGETIRYPDGVKRSVEISYVPDFGKDGIVRGYFGLIIDLSDRVRAEEELRESRDYLRLITDNLPALISYMDADRRFRFANRQMEEWYARPESEILGKSVDDVFGRSAYEKMKPRIEEALSGRAVTFEEEIEYPDGQQRSVEINYIPHVGPNGDVRGYFGLVSDIGERKRTEKELRAGQQLLQTVFDVIPHWVFVKDSNSRYMMVNNAFAESYGLQPGDFKGAHTLEMPTGSEGELALFVETDRRVLESGRRVDMMIYPATLPDGRERISHMHKMPLKDDEGNSVGLVGVLEDVTERVKAEEEVRASEHLLQTVFDAIPTPVWVKDMEGRYKMVNQALGDLFKISPRNLVGKVTADIAIVPPEIAARVEREESQVMTTRQPVVLLGEKLPLSDGRVIWQNLIKAPLTDDMGNLIGLVCVSQDVSEHLFAERELRESKELLQTIFDSFPHHLYVKDLESRFLMMNEAIARSAGWTLEEAAGRGSKDLKRLTAATKREFTREDKRVIKTGKPLKIDRKMIRYVDGREEYRSVIKMPLFDQDGSIRGVFGINEDITQRVEAEAAARKREEQLRTVIDNFPASVFFKDEQGKYLLVNKVFEEWCRLPAAEFIGKVPKDIFDSGDAEVFENDDRYVLEKREILTKELALDYPDGKRRSVLSIKFPVFDDDDNLIGVGAIGLNISERKQAEEALRESEDRLRQATRLARLGHWVWDAIEEKCIYCSEEHARIHGVSVDEYIARSSALSGAFSFTHPDDREKYKAACVELRNGTGFEMEYRILTPADQVRHVQEIARPVFDGDGRVIREYGTIQDLTETKSREEQLRQSQKMEAVGQLAGGVAHDFNNMLQVILSYAYIARGNLHAPENLSNYLDQISSGAERAANITRQLLTFSRKGVLQPEILDVNQLISDLMKMLSRVIGENIEMKILPSADPQTVNADPGMLEQVLVNLSVNARDAMPDGGRLVIETAGFRADREFCDLHGWEAPGDYVLISVSDTGEGMTEEVKEHMFEPFFTTKEAGKGTGLGLAMVYNIVRQHEGTIDVYSEPGVGSTIKIYLPAAEASQLESGESEAQLMPDGNETILVAEDEEAVRELLTELLEGHGYTVLTAGDGEKAVSTFRKRKDKIDLVILDVVMPKLSGRGAYEKIRKLHGEIPIIFSTGYAATTLDREFLARDGLKVIHKPYAPAILLHAVREAIDSPPAKERGSRSA